MLVSCLEMVKERSIPLEEVLAVLVQLDLQQRGRSILLISKYALFHLYARKQSRGKYEDRWSVKQSRVW